MKIRMIFFLACFMLANIANSQPVSYNWTNAFGGSNDDIAKELAVDLDGNIYTAGYYQGTVDFDEGPGQEIHTAPPGGGHFLTKHSATGSLLWTRVWESPNGGEIRDITADSFGSIIVVGSFTAPTDLDPTVGIDVREPVNYPASYYDTFVIKLSNNGEYVWGNTYGSGNSPTGGIGNTQTQSVATDVLGNIYLPGYFNRQVDFDPGIGTDYRIPNGQHDIYVTSVDTNGQYRWTRTIGSYSDDYAVDVSIGQQGLIAIVGTFQGSVNFDPEGLGYYKVSSGSSDSYVTTMGTNGTHLWTKTFGGVGSESFMHYVNVSITGHVYVSEAFSNQTDVNPEFGQDLRNPVGQSDVLVSKFSQDGTYEWTQTFGGELFDSSLSICSDFEGNVFVSGFFGGTVDFDPTPGIDYKIATSSSVDFYSVKINSDSTYGYSICGGGIGVDSIYGIVIDHNENLIYCGYFADTVDFDVVAGTDQKVSFGYGDIFISSISTALPVVTTLQSVSDTYLKEGQPNKNQGTEGILRIRQSGQNRSLVQFDQTAISSFVGSRSITSATLRVYISLNSDNWGANGRDVGVHRLTTNWTEFGATWNCPEDSDTGNNVPDGLQWEMNNSSLWPFVSTPSSTVLHTNGLVGWIEFDVTSDVQGFLAGNPNYGWLIKKINEGQSGSVEYSSKEGANPPQLIITAQ